MSDREGYSLVEADPGLYANYFATYRKNIWFRPSWVYLQELLVDTTGCYWIMLGNKRIAGISLAENSLGSLFILPPYSLSSEIIDFLKTYILSISADKNTIDAYNVLPEHEKAYSDCGFVKLNTRKCMIRPTDRIDAADPDFVICRQPFPEQQQTIAELLNEAYLGSAGQKDQGAFAIDVAYYFEHNTQEALRSASSAIFDRATNELIGICLVSLWEDVPLIYEIAVKPEFRSRGIGTNMLQRAISHLANDYPLIRLFVTAGNPAEYLYRGQGFLAGEETSHMSMVIYPSIETERLKLRELDLSDAEAVYRHFSDPEVTRFMDIEPCGSAEEALEIIQFHMNDAGCRYGVFLLETGELIGTCGFHCWMRGSDSRAEIGFDLSRKYWGRGIMKEAVSELLRIGFGVLKLDRIEATVDPRNTPSQRLLDRLHFSREQDMKDHLYVYILSRSGAAE